MGGQLGVDVGVQGTVGGAEVLGEQLVTAQPVVDPNENGQGGRHEAGLQARVLGGVGARGQADRPIQVVDDQGGGQTNAGDAHQEGDEHFDRRQDEYKEGNVQAELGVNLMEGRGVEELQERAPLGGQACAIRKAEEEGDPPKGRAPHGFEGLLVGAQRRRGLPARRGCAVTVGVGHGEVQQAGRNQQAEYEEADVSPPLSEDDASRAHLTEPQDLRPDDGGTVDDADDGDERGNRDRAGAGLAQLHLDVWRSRPSWVAWLIGSEDRKWEAHSNPLC